MIEVAGATGSCCGAARAPTIGDYIDRGMRRARVGSPPALGPECRDEDDCYARFGVEVSRGIVTAVGFRASPCATLIAYCELAAQRVTGRDPTAAIRLIRPVDLALELPTVPIVKRVRAQLAARALLAALLHAAMDIDS